MLGFVKAKVIKVEHSFSNFFLTFRFSRKFRDKKYKNYDKKFNFFYSNFPIKYICYMGLGVVLFILLLLCYSLI